MADWWEQYPVAGDAGGAATAEAGGNWWDQYAPAETPEPTPVVEPDPLAAQYTEAYQEILNRPKPLPFEVPDDATELERLTAARGRELFTGEPSEGPAESLRDAYENESDPELKRQRLVDFQVAERQSKIRRENLAKDREDIEARGITIDQKIMEERAKVEAGLGPDMALANAPIMRGAVTGVSNAASGIAEAALRILPGEGAPSALADKIGRQRASEGQYQAFLDEQQGSVAALPNQVTQMVGEYLPLAAVGVPAFAQVGAKGMNDAYLKSDSDSYALTSGIVQGALTYAGGKLAGGTFIDMLGGKVAGKTLGPMLKGFGAESVEELGQLYGQAMIDRGYGVGDGRMPTLKEAMWTLAVVAGARGVGTAMSANIEDDGVKQPSAFDALKNFSDRKWPSRKVAKEAGVDQIATTAKQRSELAADIRKGLTGQQFTEQLKAAATSPDEADALLEIYKARASSAGESFDDYVGKRVNGVEKTTSDKSVYLKQRDSGQPDALAQPAYHGSPHKFDKFTTDAMGTGEGAQAYGWGLYFAGNEAVAKYYREALSNPARSVQQKAMEEYDQGSDPQEAADLLFARTDLSPIERSLLESLRDNDWLGFDYPHQAVKAAMSKDFSSRFDPTPELVEVVEKARKQSGALYKVKLKPEEHEYLDWDKPLREQSLEVMDALSALFGDDFSSAEISGGSAYHRLMDIIDDDREARGAKIGSPVDAKKAVSRMLNAHGVRGIKYLDGASRKRGEGHRNFVIFDDADVTIEEVLAQKKGRTPRGEIQFLKDEGTAIIRAFEGQNLSTLLHETGHLFRRDLAGDDLAVAERWAGARGGKWNRKAEEKFARGFENYLATGKAPSKRLSDVFAKFKDWLSGVYGAIKGTAIDVNISPEMRGVFDRLLTPAESVTSRTPDLAHVSVETSAKQASTPDVETATATPDILSQDLADRFRGLANQTALPEARAANYEADVAMGFPERKGWAEAEQRAAQRIQTDPTGELSRVIDRIDQANATGGTINMENQEETALVNRLSDMLATDLANPESRALHRKLRFAFRSARSDQARALGYRDPLAVMEPAERVRKNITDAIAEPSPEEAAERKAARTPEQHAEVDRKMEERYTKAKEALARQGIDIDDIDSIVADPKKAMVVLDHLRAKGKWSDALFEYWRNSILSGPTTHATNAIGNTAFAAWNLGPERVAEAAVNLFAGNKKAASFGEFKYLLGGVMPGMVRGLRNARKSWSLETSALADELGREGAFKVDGPRGAIKGKWGRLIRAFGYRPLLAADEFAKSVVVTMEVGAHAYRNGKAMGLEGEELQTFIQQQTDDLGSASWSQAFGKAEELTFQGQRGLVAQKIAGSGHKLRQFKGARWVLPFVETPAAIFEQGIKRTPVLGAILDYAESRRSGMNIVDAGMTPTIARQLIAMGGLAMLWDAVGDDEPWLTGADTIADSKSRDLSYRARPPMSLRIGDQWYSYARIEPFATAIASTADAVKGIQNGKYYKPLTGLVQQAKEKSYLDGLGDAIDAVQGAAEGDLSATEQWGSKFAASWVPNLYRQTVRAGEGEMDENRMWGKQGDRFNRFLNRTAQQAQLPFVDSQPRFDVWGRPISYNDMGNSAATSFAFRLLSPVKSKDLSTVEQADLALIRWNEKHPDDQEVYSEPQKFITIDGETKYLTDEQHAQYAELSGQLAQEAVSGIAFDPVEPTSQQIRRIKKAITDARKMARENLVPSWMFD